MIDLNEIRNEMRIREELRRRDRSLVALIDAHSKRIGGNYLAQLIANGAVRLKPDGTLQIFSDKLRSRQNGKSTKAVASPTVPPSDYARLTQANRTRRDPMTTRWIQFEQEIHRHIARNKSPQVARVCAELCALELDIPTPAVIGWLETSPATKDKWGWVTSNLLDRINVVLSLDPETTAFVTAHECKHVEQFLKFPNLSNEQKETDANKYAEDFSLRLFAGRKTTGNLRFGC